MIIRRMACLAGAIGMPLSLAPAASDDFDSRTDLGASTSISDHLSGFSMSIEPDDPQDLQAGTIGTLWWSWTAPGDHIVSMTVEGDADGRLAVYTGTALDDLTPIQAGVMHLEFRATSGETYAIGYGSPNKVESIEFRIESAESAIRDAFSNPQILEGVPVSPTLSTFGATVDKDEPVVWEAGYNHSIWAEWQSPRRAQFQMTFPDQLAIAILRRDAPDQWTPIRWRRIDGKTVFDAEEEGVYRFGFNVKEENIGDFEMKLEIYGPPPNDHRENATELEGLSLMVNAQDFGATLENQELRLTNDSHERNARSVWYVWTAPLSGEMILTATRDHEVKVLEMRDNGRLGFLRDQSFNFQDRIITVEAGERYYFVVGSFDETGDIFSWRADYRLVGGGQTGSWRSPPSNDRFADAFDLGSQLPVHSTGSTYRGFIEANEPEFNIVADKGGSSWWRWRPEKDVYVKICLEYHRSSEPRLLVYSGEILSSLQLEAYSTKGWTSFAADSAQTYYVCVADRHLSGPRQVALQLEEESAPPPAADAFAGRIDLGAVASLTLDFSNQFASKEVLEPNHITGLITSRSLWWEWEAPHTGTFAMETDHDHALAIYIGSEVDSLELVSPGARVHLLSAVEGQSYQFALDGVPGEGRFTLNAAAIPPNDDWSNASALELGSFSAVYAHATREVGEPEHEGVEEQGGSLWWKWQASGSGGVELDASASTFPALVGVYQGSNLTELQWIGDGRTRSTTRFRAVEGEHYWIAVATPESGQVGRLHLTSQFLPNPPVNDDIADASEVSLESGTWVEGTTAFATVEPGEDLIVDNQRRRSVASVWWTWQVPESRTYLLDVTGGDWQLYLGNEEGPLESIETISQGSDDIFTAIEGDRLWLTIVNTLLDGDCQWRVDFGPALTNNRVIHATNLGSNEHIDFSGTTIGATLDPGEAPLLQTGDPTGSVWWAWTAPRDGYLSVLYDQSWRFDSFTHDYFLTDPLNDIGEQLPLQGEWIPVSTEQSVLIRVEATPMNFSGTLHFVAPEEGNGDFERREKLESLDHLEFRGSLVEHEAAPSYWWEWQAPSSGDVRIASRNSTFLSGSRVWKEANGELELVMDDSLRFSAEAAVTYYIELPPENTFRLFTLSLSEPVMAPVHEELFNARLAQAHSLVGDQVSLVASTAVRFREFAEPWTAMRQRHPYEETVWFRWQAPRSGPVSLHAKNTDERTLYAGVYQGDSLTTLKPLISRRADLEIHFHAQQNEVYHIGLFNVREFYEVHLEMGARNSLLEDAIDLRSQENISGTADLRMAFAREGAPATKGPWTSTNVKQRQLWWKWQAPSDGMITWSGTISNSVAPLGLGAFQGRTLTSLSPIAQGSKQISFPGEQGQTYLLVVEDGLAREEVTYALEFSLKDIPIESTAFVAWKERNFQGEPNSLTSTHADPDKDGNPNWMEFALGKDPLDKASLGELGFQLSAESLTIHHAWPLETPQLKIRYEGSDDLMEWKPLQEGSHFNRSSEPHAEWDHYTLTSITFNADQPFVRAVVTLEE